MKQKGFTLLEILLVIAAIGILAAIVIVAINPTRQLSQVRNSERLSESNSLAKAFDQYLIDTGSYPTGVTNSYQELCAQDAADCTGYLDLGGGARTRLSGCNTHGTRSGRKWIRI